MAAQWGFQIESSLATQHLTDSKYIQGGYIVVSTIAERDTLPIKTDTSDGVIIEGSLVYVSNDKKSYRYINGTWAEDSGKEISLSSINKTILISGSNVESTNSAYISAENNQIFDTNRYKFLITNTSSSPDTYSIAYVDALTSSGDSYILSAMGTNTVPITLYVTGTSADSNTSKYTIFNNEYILSANESKIISYNTINNKQFYKHLDFSVKTNTDDTTVWTYGFTKNLMNTNSAGVYKLQKNIWIDNNYIDSETFYKNNGISLNPFNIVRDTLGWNENNEVNSINGWSIAGGKTYSAADNWTIVDNTNNTVGWSTSAKNTWNDLNSAYNSWKNVSVPPTADDNKIYGIKNNAWTELTFENYKLSDTVISAKNVQGDIELQSVVDLSMTDDNLLKFNNGKLN